LLEIIMISNGEIVDLQPVAGKNQSASAQFMFLAGGSEMAGRIRAYNWQQSPLGPIEDWPQSLRTAISLILNTQHPMWVGWGPNLTFFYNDAYISGFEPRETPAGVGQTRRRSLEGNLAHLRPARGQGFSAR
jgi:hypothetical protein